jgi:hypothetical protein
MQSGQQPSRGLISIREERLFHFQKYIHEKTIGLGKQPVVMS